MSEEKATEQEKAVAISYRPDIEGAGLPMTSPEELEQNLKLLEKGIETYRRYTITALKLVPPKGIIRRVSQRKGKTIETFELSGPGIEPLGTPFGLSFSIPNIRWETVNDPKKGRYEAAWCDITVTSALLGGRSESEVGYCDTLDPFFVARGDFNRGDIAKSAVTNAKVRAVAKLIGIRAITRDMIEDAKINVDDVETIEYGSAKASDVKSAPPKSSPPKASSPKGDEPSLGEQKNSILEKLAELSDNDKGLQKEILMALTRYETKDKPGEWKGEKDSIAKLTDKQVPVVLDKIKDIKKADVQWLLECGDYKTFQERSKDEEQEQDDIPF